MARPKKIIEAIKKVITKQEVVKPQVVAPKFDPSIPENKQRHLR